MNCGRQVFKVALAMLCVSSIGAAAQSGGQTSAAVKPEDWYKQSDRRSLILRDTMLDADEGKVEAMIPLGLTLLSGWGRAEGPHPQAALYWLNTAADRGEHKALEYLAVILAAGEAVPRDEKKAHAYLDAHAVKTGKPIKSEQCGDDDACSRYHRLIATHWHDVSGVPAPSSKGSVGGGVPRSVGSGNPEGEDKRGKTS